MKFIGLTLATVLLLADTSSAHKLHHHRPHHDHSMIQVNLKLNDEILGEVNEKLNKAQSLMQTKSEPACDDDCKKNCDEKADSMIRELKNPLHEITWNCKNNYNVYTTDYDPEHNHFDRIAQDVMDVNRVMNKISVLEKERKEPWTWN
jgi:hypothetical protein